MSTRGSYPESPGSGFDVHSAVLSLWGKSNQGGRPNRLLQHLYDTAAVGEVMWDRYLPVGLRDRLDAITDGGGRRFFALLCGLHDVGKATPNFQSQDPRLAERVRAAGLAWNPRRVRPRTSDWHHTVAGSHIVADALKAASWPADQIIVYVRLHGPDNTTLYAGCYPHEDLRWWAAHPRVGVRRPRRVRVIQQRRRRQRRPQRPHAPPDAGPLTPKRPASVRRVDIHDWRSATG